MQSSNQQHQEDAENGSGADTPSLNFQYPTPSSAANYTNTSTIEQQLDLKYKAYSTSQNQTTAGKPGQTLGAGISSQGMLPQHSQFLYSNNLRASMDKLQTDSGNASGGMGAGSLDMTSGGLQNQYQHQQQYLNMNASMGSQQNQNLGPTQIFYQGVLPPPTTSQPHQPQLTHQQTQNQGTGGGSGGAFNQNQLLAQLLGQGGLAQTGMNSNNGGSGNSQQINTQMLLLELLRQNNMQMQQQNQFQQQNQVSQAMTPDANSNPANQSMYGQGFLSAQQLLAQTSAGGMSNQQTTQGSSNAAQSLETPAMSKTSSSSQSTQPTAVQQSQQFDPSQFLSSHSTSGGGATHQHYQPSQQHTGSSASTTGFSQNLNQIYQNLNNYQQMIDNLESSALPSAASKNPSAGSNPNDISLNQSRYQIEQTTNSYARGASQQNQQQQQLSQQAHPQTQQTQNQQSSPVRGMSSYERWRTTQTNMPSVSNNDEKPLSSQSRLIDAFLGPPDEAELPFESQNLHFRQPTRDYQGAAAEKNNDDDEINWAAARNDEEQANVMWPSAQQKKPLKPEHTKQSASNQHQSANSRGAGSDSRQQQHQSEENQRSFSGIEWVSSKENTKQPAASNYRQNASADDDYDETAQHSSNFGGMHTDFNQRDEYGSEFDQNRDEEKRAVKKETSNHWMRQSKNGAAGLDIDEMPIPTAGDRPKTFEELLAEKMEAAEALNSASIGNNAPQEVPKKQFLKRKQPAYVPPRKAPTKQYKYYSDAIARAKGGRNPEDQSSLQDPSARNTQNSRRGAQQSDERKDKRQRNMTPNSAAMNSSGRVRDNSEFGGDMPAPQQNTHQAMESEKRPVRNTSQPPQANQPPAPPIPAKPFLKRGTGTAHLQGRMQNKNASSANNLQKQEQSKPATPKLEKANSKGAGLFQKQQSHQRNNPSQQYHQQMMMDEHINEQSMDDFQKLEQACNSGSGMMHKPSSLPPRQQQPQPQKKKKLFDDSDSDQDEPQDDPVRNQNVQHNTYDPAMYGHNNQASPSQGGRSNLVKKMFYKDQTQGGNTQGKQNQQLNRGGGQEDDEAKPYPMNSQMEALLAKKQEQLEKAIQQYNVDNEQLNQKKAQYDNMLRKLRVDQREVEAQKKRTAEELERLKEEEMGKVRKEKKALEQRQKNFQLVSNTAKKEREEIDALRREFNKYKADAELKAKKQQSTIERLTKQNNELKQKTKELQEDLRAMEQQRIILEKGSNANSANALNKSTNQVRQNPSQQQQNSQSRYNFSAQQQSHKSGSDSNVRRQGSTENNNFIDKNQMLFREDEGHHQPDADDDDEDDQFRKEQQQHYNRHGANHDMGGGDEEDEEDLQDEEADQVYDDFGSGLLMGNNTRGALSNSSQNQDQTHHSMNTQASGQNLGSKQPTAGAAISDEEEDFSLKFPKEYHGKTVPNQKVVEQFVGHDGKIQRIYQNGKKEVIFNNGVKRESFPDGYTIVYFNNHDIKQTFADGKVVYYFAEAQTTQTTFPDKLQVFKFSNNQIEKHFPDKTKEIIFPDGTIKCIFEDGEEESIFPDGTIQKIEKSGIKAIEFANGQKDILYPDGIRVREFPDGKVRKTYPDGRTEVYQR